MTKIYLNKYLSIVLTVISALLSFVYIFYTYTLYNISLKSPEALIDPGYRYKFVETVVYALVFLAMATYFAIKAFLNKPLIEVKYEDDFVYEELEEVTEDEDEEESEDEESEEETDEDEEDKK